MADQTTVPDPVALMAANELEARLEAATLTIRRLRDRYTRDLQMEGYDADEAAEMLRQVEAGEDEW